MKNETFQIRIGNELFLNKIGVFITIVGFLFGIIILVIFFAGTYLPLEMKIIFYFELLSRNIYLSFFISILSVIVGFKMSNIKRYKETILILEENKLTFKKKEELIELPKWKINRIIERKNNNRNIEQIRIKTTVGKQYELKTEVGILEKLLNMFPYKIRLNKKNVG